MVKEAIKEECQDYFQTGDSESKKYKLECISALQDLLQKLDDQYSEVVRVSGFYKRLLNK